jgi:uncharacterized LabA/DUF88 family protein
MTASNARSLTKLVLLIDGENLDSKYAGDLMERASALGTFVTKRIYGQRDNARMIKWDTLLAEHGLTKVDVSKISREKDSADFKLVVEAMDMLHGRQLDGFCVASSDGDFSALADRVRANALAFYGFGEKKAPAPYKARCTRFVELDPAKKAAAPSTPKKTAPSQAKPASKSVSLKKPLQAKPAPTKAAAKSTKPQPQARPTPAGPPPVPLDKLLAAIEAVKGEDDGWTHLQRLGLQLSRAGYSPASLKFKTPKLVRAYPNDIEITMRGNDTYVRRKLS